MIKNESLKCFPPITPAFVQPTKPNLPQGEYFSLEQFKFSNKTIKS